MEQSTIEKINQVALMLGVTTVNMDPVGMTAEENTTDAEWLAQTKEAYRDDTAATDPAQRETFDEVWQDVRSDLATLERLYVARAKKSFRDRLREMLTEITGELDLKDV